MIQWRRPRNLIAAALLMSVVMHVFVGLLSEKWLVVPWRNDGNVGTSGVRVLQVRLASRGLVVVAPAQMPQVPPVASFGRVGSAVPGSSNIADDALASDAGGSTFFTGHEIDVPAEFTQPVDFDSALQGVPLVNAVIRAQIYVDDRGVVRKLAWHGATAPAEVIERLGSYLGAQQFRPARKAGRDVASVLTIEFEIGPPRTVEPRASDVPLIQEVAPGSR